MLRKIFSSTPLIAIVATFLSLSAAAQVHKSHLRVGITQAGTIAPVGTEEPCISNPCLFYAGDYDDNGPGANNLWNAYNPYASNFGSNGVLGKVYVPFTVPKRWKGARGKTAWNVKGLFVNSLLLDAGMGISVTSVDWSIVQGVVPGVSPDQLKTVCSGTGVPTVTPTGRSGGGTPEYTLLLTGISCPILEAGTYWMTFLPTTGAYAWLNDVEDNTPANMEGPGTEPVDQSYFYSPDFDGLSYLWATAPNPHTSPPFGACGTNGCDKFSVGIIGTATK